MANQINPVKEHVKGGRLCVVRLNHYGHGLSHFDLLFEAAQSDFPTLSRQDVKVIKYGGKTIKGYWGIEFEAPSGAIIPSTYTEISESHLTL